MRHPLPLLFALILPFLAFAQTPPVTPPVPTVTLKWNAVTMMSDGNPIPSGVSVSYNVYGAHTASGPWILAANVFGTSSTRSNVEIGNDCYTLTAVISGKESAQVSPICVNVTPSVSTVPASPSGLSVTQTQ